MWCVTSKWLSHYRETQGAPRKWLEELLSGSSAHISTPCPFSSTFPSGFHSNQKFWKFLKHGKRDRCQENINTALSGWTIIFRRYAAKKVKDMLRKLIYLPIPRHHKVFPKSNLGIFSSRSLPGRVEQDQAEEERPALQASSQLYVTFSIDEEYPRVFKVIQDYLYKLWLSGKLPQSTAGWSCSGSSLRTRERGSRSTCDCYQCDLHLISDPTYQVGLYLSLFVAELPNFCRLESVVVRNKFKQSSWICI